MITVAGLTPSLDLTYTVPALAPGRIHRVPEVVRTAGGKALNMARAASTAGADCHLVALLGGPTGELLATLLRQEGLPVTVVGSPAETRICVSVSAEDTAELTELYQDAAALPDGVWRAFSTAVQDALAVRPGWLSVSGRAPAGAAGLIADLVDTGRAAGVRVAVDTHSEALPEALEARPALVKINRYEAADLLGVPSGGDLAAMAEALHHRCGALVVLTDQTAGAVACDGRLRVRAELPAVVGRYPVGSGDSFLGGLLAVLDAAGDLEQALRTATACGVANALVPGQGHFTRAAMERIAAQVRLTPLE